MSYFDALECCSGQTETCDVGFAPLIMIWGKLVVGPAKLPRTYTCFFCSVSNCSCGLPYAATFVAAAKSEVD